MKRTLVILGTLALGLAAFFVLSADSADLSPAASDAPDELGNRVSRWGTRQRLGGAGNKLAGHIEQAAGSLTGNPDLSTQGTVDRLTGAARDAAGQTAHAVADTLNNLSR